MHYLQSLSIIHRDLKLANLLIHFPDLISKEDTFESDWVESIQLSKTNFVVKIADLGFSKILDDVNDFSSTYCGTPINMAPEVLNREQYNHKADVWSVGTMLFELLAGYSPFKEAQNKEQLRKR